MSATVEDILATLDGLSIDEVEVDEPGRRKIIASVERALARLRTPYEVLWHIGFINPMLCWVLRVLVDVGLFEGWAENGGKEATLHELWEMCKVPRLDIELLRMFSGATCLTNLLRSNGR